MQSTTLQPWPSWLTTTPLSSVADEPMIATELLIYIEAELNGQDAAQLYPQVQLRLKSSPACQQEYRELRELLSQEQRGQWQEPSQAATFDFAYLPVAWPLPVTAAADFWTFDESGRLYIFFSAAHLARSRPAALPADYARFREEMGTILLYEGKINSGRDLDVIFSVWTASTTAKQCFLLIKADIPSSGWPDLGGTRVALMNCQTKEPEQFTDPFGNVLFEDFPVEQLAGLTVVIEPGPRPAAGG